MVSRPALVDFSGKVCHGKSLFFPVNKCGVKAGKSLITSFSGPEKCTVDFYYRFPMPFITGKGKIFCRREKAEKRSGKG